MDSFLPQADASGNPDHGALAVVWGSAGLGFTADGTFYISQPGTPEGKKALLQQQREKYKIQVKDPAFFDDSPIPATPRTAQ